MLREGMVGTQVTGLHSRRPLSRGMDQMELQVVLLLDPAVSTTLLLPRYRSAGRAGEGQPRAGTLRP